MWKRSAVFARGKPRRTLLLAFCSAALAAALLGLIGSGLAPRVSGQALPAGLPPGPMQEKARTACLPCHTASIIVQQQLDRRVWTKEMDKMIRWGAPVAPEDREALIDYFARHFGPREPAPTEVTLPLGRHSARARPRGYPQLPGHAFFSARQAGREGEEAVSGRDSSRRETLPMAGGSMYNRAVL